VLDAAGLSSSLKPLRAQRAHFHALFMSFFAVFPKLFVLAMTALYYQA
jgi:hypothetical protein